MTDEANRLSRSRECVWSRPHKGVAGSSVYLIYDEPITDSVKAPSSSLVWLYRRSLHGGSMMKGWIQSYSVLYYIITDLLGDSCRYQAYRSFFILPSSVLHSLQFPQ